MKIFKSPEFIAEFNKLTKRKYIGTYGALQREIADFFSVNNTFEKVWAQNYPLVEQSNFRINKIRLENPSQNSGKSGGLRLIVICDNRDESIGLLFVFPKTGPHGMNNIDTKFQKKLIQSYKAAKEDHLLVEFIIPAADSK